MGADFKYAGSTSYGRLNDELKGIVELFGGKCISEREDYDTGSPFLKPLGYFMEEPCKCSFCGTVNECYTSEETDEYICFAEGDETV